MRRVGLILSLVFCFVALMAGGVQVVAQEKQTDTEAKRADEAKQSKAQRALEAEQNKEKRAAESTQLKARRKAETAERTEKRALEITRQRARLANETDRVKAQRAISAEQAKVAKRAVEATRRAVPPDGTFKLLGSRLNLGKTVKGAPYSATAITESNQTLSDGNQIIHRDEAAYYRDSEGRTRIEQTLKKIGKWVAAGDPKRIVMIADPVAGYYYSLDPNERKATKSPLFNRVARPLFRGDEVERQKSAWERQLKSLEDQEKKQRQALEDQWEKRRRDLDEQRSKPGQMSDEEWTKQKRMLEEQRAKEKEAFDEQREKARERLEQNLKERKERLEQDAARRKQDASSPKPIPANSLIKPQPTASAEAKHAATATQSVQTVQSVNGKKTESLGKRVVEGVEAEGTRTTSTIPAGEIGNTLPINVVDESWYSRELQVPVMTRHHDPRSGDNVFRLTNINRSEPARSLFEIPDGYTIVENAGSKPTAVPSPSRIGPKPASPNLPKPEVKAAEPVQPAVPKVP